MSALQITYRPIAALRPRSTNPRTHSRKQLDQLARAISKFGFTNPVLIDDDDVLIAGHGRVEAAKLVGLTEVPTKDLARRHHLCLRYTAKLLPLAYLAPELTTAIIQGRQPRGLTLSALTAQPLPLHWDDQRQLITVLIRP